VRNAQRSRPYSPKQKVVTAVCVVTAEGCYRCVKSVNVLKNQEKIHKMNSDTK